MNAPAVLFTGGARSGKSALAQAFAERHAPPLLFIATAQAPGGPGGEDEEMSARIARHQAVRGPAWSSLEAPLDLPAALGDILKRASHGAVLIDCVTLWISNLMGAGHNSAAILNEVRRLAALLERASLPVAIVTNEVGSGIVPAYASGREFRDLAGEANQVLARACSHVVLAVCGLPVPVTHQGGPLP